MTLFSTPQKPRRHRKTLLTAAIGTLITAASLTLSTVALSTVALSTAQAADLDEIKERGYMVVATEDNYSPFNFIENGNATGFNKDMLEALRQYADFEVRQEILPWTGLLAAVAGGQYDMALTGALVTDDRLRVFNYTPPYGSAQHFYIKRADDDRLNSIADLDGKTLGVQAGSALLARLPELKTMLSDQGKQLGKVVEYESYPEAFADLANGRLDYVIDAVIPANTLVASKPDIFAKGQAVSGPGFVSWPIPKRSPELLAYMTGFMKHMRDSGKLAELQKKWFGESFPNMPQTPIKSVDQFHDLISDS